MLVDVNRYAKTPAYDPWRYDGYRYVINVDMDPDEAADLHEAVAGFIHLTGSHKQLQSALDLLVGAINEANRLEAEDQAASQPGQDNTIVIGRAGGQDNTIVIGRAAGQPVHRPGPRYGLGG